MWKNYHYKKRHDSLINTYGTIEKPKDRYTEGHHIIPKSLGGVDKDNIIYLPARVHLLVHWCLAKGTEHQKMIGAFGWMSQRVHRTDFRIGARTYEAAQKAQSEAASIRFKERTVGKASLNRKYTAMQVRVWNRLMPPKAGRFKRNGLYLTAKEISEIVGISAHSIRCAVCHYRSGRDKYYD
jgi:hypothetical protein